MPTDFRPDIVWWDSNSKSECIADLTVCFESNFVDAAERKTAKYADLVQWVVENGYTLTFIPLQVGTGITTYLIRPRPKDIRHNSLLCKWGLGVFKICKALATSLSLSGKKLVGILEVSSRQAHVGSSCIWCSRNKFP